MVGFCTYEWNVAVILFGFIPIYYICSHHFIKFIDKEKSFWMSVKGVLDACVPIVCGVLFILLMIADCIAPGFIILCFIPIYYIVASHLAKKTRN